MIAERKKYDPVIKVLDRLKRAGFSSVLCYQFEFDLGQVFVPQKPICKKEEIPNVVVRLQQ